MRERMVGLGSIGGAALLMLLGACGEAEQAMPVMPTLSGSFYGTWSVDGTVRTGDPAVRIQDEPDGLALYMGDLSCRLRFTRLSETSAVLRTPVTCKLLGELVQVTSAEAVVVAKTTRSSSCSIKTLTELTLTLSQGRQYNGTGPLLDFQDWCLDMNCRRGLC